MMREKERENETTITSKMIEELKRKVNDLTQQNIVLDETNKVIEKRKKQLEKVQELTEGRLASEHVEVANMRAELMEAQQTCASLASETATDLEAVVLLPFLVPNLVAEVDLQH